MTDPVNTVEEIPGVARKLLALRIFHSTLSVFFLACVGLLYYAGLTGDMRGWAWWGVAILAGEGLLLAVNRCDCPLSGMHHALGDDKGFFGLSLPESWLPWVLPVLTVVSIAGLGLLVFGPGATP